MGGKTLSQLNIDQPFENVDIETVKSAVASSRSPLIITDNRLPDNPIIYSNQAFCDLTGYAMSEIIGKNCRFLQGEDRDQPEVKQLRQAVDGSQSLRTTLKNYRKDGTPFWNDLIITPITDDTGQTTHFVGMQLDITERIVAAERLQAKTRELETANAELEQFTYAVSHDLQEPLRMISSYLQLIMQRYGDSFDKDAVTFMGFASEGAERLQDLIYDLLALSRLSTTDEKFKPTAMKTAVERALLNLKVSVEESQAQVSVIGPLPTLSVDAVQMTQLFQNLIGNAIKYRKPDVQPVITVSAKKRGGDYVFSVSDNGIGISKQYYKRIFGVFQRLHTRSEYQGTGVGLSICSKIVDRHGGNIWVESVKDKGSAFYFSLPAERKDQ